MSFMRDIVVHFVHVYHIESRLQSPDAFVRDNELSNRRITACQANGKARASFGLSRHRAIKLIAFGFQISLSLSLFLSPPPPL